MQHVDTKPVTSFKQTSLSVPQLLLKACFTNPQNNTAMKSKSSPAVHAAWALSFPLHMLHVCVRHFNDHHPFLCTLDVFIFFT